MCVHSQSGYPPRDKTKKCANSRVALQFPKGNGELHAATQMTPRLTPCKKNARPVLNPWTGVPHLRQGLACRGGMREANRIRLPELPKVMLLWTDDNLTRGVSPRPVFSVHGGDIPNGWARARGRLDPGGTRFDPPLTRIVVFPQKLREKLSCWDHSLALARGCRRPCLP